jgi:O-methyltransferase involved in polyketide biosynthesis
VWRLAIVVQGHHKREARRYKTNKSTNDQATGEISVRQDKVKVKLSGVSQSMLGCLWGRAQLSKRYPSLFYDAKAIELVEKIDYDDLAADEPLQDLELRFFCVAHQLDLPEVGPITLRARLFDEMAKAYMKEHPRASVVNLGAGLDTTFYRVDNGLIHWYDLDLPEVIDVRRQLLPEPDRVTYIAKSIFDPSWCADVSHSGDGVFMIAGGVFHWFEESQVKQFFSLLADNFDGGEIVFNVISRPEHFGRWTEFLSPEQREAVKAAQIDTIREWWKNAPQDQRRQLTDVIATLDLPTKPKGSAWADLEAWWHQLSDKELMEVMRGFMKSFRSGADTWTLEDAHEIEKWDRRITVIEQVPMFKDIPRDSVDADMRRFLDYSDEIAMASIVHLRV